jgi:hypothetical protein
MFMMFSCYGQSLNVRNGYRKLSTKGIREYPYLSCMNEDKSYVHTTTNNLWIIYTTKIRFYRPDNSKARTMLAIEYDKNKEKQGR